MLVGALLAHAATEDAWLGGLTERVVADLAADRPRVHDHPLWQRQARRGRQPRDQPLLGDHARVRRVVRAQGGGWKRVVRQRAGETGDQDILAVHAYRRSITAPAAWRKAGATKTFELDVVIHGWRGSAIDRALGPYVADADGQAARTLTFEDGATLDAGGAAQIVAWVGHNRLMDLDHYVWPAPAPTARGTIAIACDTASYMEADVPAATRVPAPHDP